MADPLRDDTLKQPNNLRENTALDDPSVEALLPGVPDQPSLPRPENPRLNRTAESIGSALGSTVGKVRSGLTLVQTRSEEKAREVADNLSQRAEAVSASAIEKAEHLGDVAEEKAAQFLDSAQEGWESLRQTAQRGLAEARRQVAIAREEHPIELILGFAALAFAAGFALRVWRSND